MAANSTASSWNIGLRAPHYCGIIERVIGTAMSMVHELPGSTFSNPVERGAYDPQATAALTLTELERWLILTVGARRIRDTPTRGVLGVSLYSDQGPSKDQVP
ncbi:hypothetical protein ACWF62_09065 [Rhodococcus sp. NPDC054953]